MPIIAIKTWRTFQMTVNFLPHPTFTAFPKSVNQHKCLVSICFLLSIFHRCTRTDLHGVCARVRNPSSRRFGGAALCLATDQCLQRPVARGLGIARSFSICISILFLIITIVIIVIITISDIESGHQPLRAVAGRGRHRRRLSARLCGVRFEFGCESNAQWLIDVVESCSTTTI
jgi:hypothetical protein